MSIDDVQACLEDAGLKVQAQTAGEVEQLLVDGGEVEGGTTVAVYPTEEDATQNADAAKDVTGGDVQQYGTTVVISQGGPESDQVQGCVG